ncbi:hypothetical protein J120_01055 [candidate division TM6 bacterium JCVI TM6SC1]|uniref:Sodium:solute symporter n=1 Tax=candidate division TM6 bacterium JCVI TM6SC1 TaxID=1306947 RepID=A0A0D2I2X1_9BACT|nr:hypothetical protein J120_01055 [candidate division TM6 bacterium JCVI TM6SC1]
MNSLLFFGIFSLLGLIYFIIGLRVGRTVTSTSDYYLAGRSLGIAQVTSNLIATQLGGGMLLGTAMASYTHGVYGIVYTLGMSIGFILLACGIAARLQQFNVSTTAQLFQTQYHSIFLKKVASLLSICTLFGILIAQVVGFKSLMYALGFTNIWSIIPFWLSVVAYTMAGGLRAITINDMIQLTLIITIFSSLFIRDAFVHGLSNITQFAMSMTRPSQSLIATILMPALFSLFQQDLAQRFFASRSQRTATLSACYAGLFLLVFACIPLYFGIQPRLTNMSVPEGANPLIVYLENTVPTLLFALAMCAIIAAIISTADALLNGISANITQDFNITDSRGGMTVSKIITGIVGLSALIASYFVPLHIIDIIISSYELSVSCLLVPLLVCYFTPKVSTWAAYGSIVGGFIGFIGIRFISLPGKEIVSLLLSCIGYILGMYIQKTTQRTYKFSQ